MRPFRALAAVTAAALPVLVSAGPAAAASAVTFRCSTITITYVFDNDQTGGWWTVTTSMDCLPPRYFKRYSLEVYERPFTKELYLETTPYVTGGYSKTVIVPATPISANKSACVSAHSEVYNFDHDVMDEQTRNTCFKTATP
jgi:hypothetical protein